MFHVSSPVSSPERERGSPTVIILLITNIPAAQLVLPGHTNSHQSGVFVDHPPEWSGALSFTLIGLSFIELKYFHDVATPALLCHIEPARSIQSPLLGALKRK